MDAALGMLRAISSAGWPGRMRETPGRRTNQGGQHRRREGQPPHTDRTRPGWSMVPELRLNRRPDRVGRRDGWQILHHRHAGTDVLIIGAALRALSQVGLNLLRGSRGQCAIDIRRKLAGDMPRPHRHPFGPFTFFSRSASILCPRLSLEATVPIEQSSALAISSYERSSK